MRWETQCWTSWFSCTENRVNTEVFPTECLEFYRTGFWPQNYSVEVFFLANYITCQCCGLCCVSSLPSSLCLYACWRKAAIPHWAAQFNLHHTTALLDSSFQYLDPGWIRAQRKGRCILSSTSCHASSWMQGGRAAPFAASSIVSTRLISAFLKCVQSCWVSAHFLKLIGNFFQLRAATRGGLLPLGLFACAAVDLFFSVLQAWKCFLLFSGWFPKEVESCGITLFLGVSLCFQPSGPVQRNLSELQDVGNMVGGNEEVFNAHCCSSPICNQVLESRMFLKVRAV